MQGSTAQPEVGQDAALALSVLESMPEMSVLVFDARLVFVLCAGKALGRHGYSAGTTAGRRCADVLRADRWQVYEPLYRAALRGESHSLEIGGLDGESRYEVSIGPLRSDTGEVIGGLVIARDASARVRAETESAHSRQLLEDVLDSVSAGVSVKDADRRFLLVNRAFEAMQSFERDHLRGRTMQEVFETEVAAECDAEDLQVIGSGQAASSERTVRLPYGEEKTLLIGRSPLRDANGRVYGLCAVATDISERTAIERDLVAARGLFEQVLDSAPIGMALFAVDGRLTRVNRAFCALTGYRSDALTGMTFRELTHPDDRESSIEAHRRLLAGEITTYRTQKRYVHADGHTILAQVSVSLVRDPDGWAQYLILQAQDISDQKRMEADLRRLADQDSLTGLANRRVFEEALAVQISRCQRYGESAQLLLIDLDGFKQVNDRHGHTTGDHLLEAIAESIRSRLRATDLVARIGGDEFAVLLLQVSAATREVAAQSLRRAIATTAVPTDTGPVALQASIGIADLGPDTRHAEAALRAADAAMYVEKRRTPR